MSRLAHHTALALAVVAFLVGAPRAFGTEVWTPETGSGDLEDVPPDSAQERFEHACGLVAAEQYSAGIQMLEDLVDQHPEADFVPRARYTIALARYGQEKHTTAYRRLQGFRSRYPDHELAESARQLQIKCLREVASRDVEDGLALLDEMVSEAQSSKRAGLYQKLRGDLYFEAKSYLFARDAYDRLVQDFPQSEWVPYAFHRMALCELRLGEWLGRGTEHIVKARRTLEHFLEVYSDHPLAEKARASLEEARALEAGWNAKHARYYLDQDKPGSAAVYLKYILDNFPHTDHAEWAGEELERIRQAGRLPPGMSPAEAVLPAGQQEEDSGSESGASEQKSQ